MKKKFEHDAVVISLKIPLELKNTMDEYVLSRGMTITGLLTVLLKAELNRGDT